MIKVLHFVSTPSIGSGVMSVIMNYYRHMDRSRIQFDFLCFIPCEESYEEEIKSLGGRVFFIPKPGLSHHSLKKMKQFFMENRGTYQWLHNHEVYLTFILEPLANIYGIKHFIVHSHATKYSDRKLAALRNSILCLPLRFTKSRKFACSEDAGRFLFGAASADNGEIYILHNAIDIKKYAHNMNARSDLRKKYGLENCYVIGHVGRFVPQKNHRFLISVFDEVIKTAPASRLVLIGDGPLEKDILQECHGRELSDFILFLGQRNDVENLLSIMDIFVLPSTFEGIGVALLEAQANGLCGIASDNVPREANVTGNVRFLPLETKLWVNALTAQASQISRQETSNIEIEAAFKQKHFDIETEAIKFQRYYENTNTHVHI